MSLFKLTRWPTILVFLLAGATAVIFAFVTVNLFSHAMANVGFLRRSGVDAIRHGALVQAVELMFWGGIALACWIVFKICEHVLVDRYFSWANDNSDKKKMAEIAEKAGSTAAQPDGKK